VASHYGPLQGLDDSIRLEPRAPSRAQARAALGGEFPTAALSMAARVPNSTLAHVSCALSKIPYVGFSPVRLQARGRKVSGSLPECHGTLSAAPTYRPTASSLLPPSPASCGTQTEPYVRGLALHRALRTALPKGHRLPEPTGSSLRGGYAVHPHPRYYNPIRPSWSLPSTSRLITAYRSGLCHAKPSWLRPRGSLLYLTTPSMRAVARTPGGGLSASARFFLNPSAFPGATQGRLLQHPDTGFRQVALPTLQRSLYATALMVARPPVPARPEDSSPAAEDFYFRAFPGKGHPSPESGITTRHLRADAMTGLSPAGVLLLQAASCPGLRCFAPLGLGIFSATKPRKGAIS